MVRRRRRRRRRIAERKGKRMNCKNEFLEEKLRICAHSLTCSAHPGNGKVDSMGAAWLNFLAGEMWAELENIENNNNPNENNNENPNENNENNNKKHQYDKQRKEPGRMRKNAANSNINEIFEDKD